VDRARNEEADELAKAAARGESLPSDVFYHVIGTPTVRSPEGLQITNDTEGRRIVNLIMTNDTEGRPNNPVPARILPPKQRQRGQAPQAPKPGLRNH
jgi:hypothetical protein